MGKLVKFCSSCDEGFAERFAFCPTCGATLQAFEMQPVEAPQEILEPVPAVVEAAPLVEVVPERSESAFAAADIVDEPILEETFEAGHIDEIEIEEPVEEEDEVPVTIAVPAAAAVFAAPVAMYADEPRGMTVTPEALDSGYYITVIDEKNGSQRNWLLLGSAVFCVIVALSATVYSLFDKDLGIGAIDDGNLFSAVIVDEPMTVEEEKIEQKKDDEGGGGGGGGRDEKDPTSQGDLADQSPKPTRPPDVNVPRFEAELVTPPPQTEGVRKFPKEFNRWGDPNSKFAGLSNGTGTGGGQGSGVGTGQGSGRGTGTGSGTGSGSGSGNGDGDGDGDGSGGGGGPPPKAVAAVTQPLKIISKPRAGYTDAARTNNVQGSVRLKVTFLASGAIGSVVPVTRLPHGLTEQAIAAAKQIRFEPKKINGVAQNVIVTMDYGFNIY